ncbi:hypothetical protein N7486_011377 [Penicillium sp. IBT 16267x]|nr:hypothetical protein N7486_011377 [Penicillium sp. IBT 16267x]
MVAKRGVRKRRAPSPASSKKNHKRRRVDGREPIVADDGAEVVSRGIIFEDLDLDTSYVGNVIKTNRQRPHRQQWEYIEEDIAAGKLPAGWNYEEPDLDKNDIDAQIERCHERIKEKIMPHIFKEKLAEYEKRKATKEELIAEYPGLDWLVIQRIKTLQEIDDWLEESEDKYKLRGNVKAVTDTYKSRKLTWTPGLVTYWSKGVQVSEPRPWNIDENAAIAKHFGGDEDFWVEECKAESEQVLLGHTWQGEQHMNPTTHHVEHQVQLRIFESDSNDRPGTRSLDLNVIDDTGSDFMCIYEQDYDDLHRLYDTAGIECGAPLSGVAYVKQFDGNRAFCQTRIIWVNIHIPDTDQPLGCWTMVRCVMWSHSRLDVHAPPRINGPWLRSILYSASLPSGDGNWGSNVSFFGPKSWFNVNIPVVRDGVHDRPVPRVAQEVFKKEWVDEAGGLNSDDSGFELVLIWGWGVC